MSQTLSITSNSENYRLLLRRLPNNWKFQLIDMAAVSQVPISDMSVDGLASIADDFHAAVRNHFNDVTSLFVTRTRSANICDWVEQLIWIGHRLKSRDDGWVYRLVIEACNKEFGHDSIFRDVALRHLLPREYLLATVINEYLSKNDLTHATEEICSLRSSEIQQIKGIYPSLFGRELEDDLETCTFGNYRKLLLKNIRVRHRMAGVSKERLENIVRYLHEKVQETYKCAQLAIMDLVYELNEEDLRVVVERYSTEYRKPLVEDLMLAGYEHFEHGLVTKIQCAMNRPKYYAEKLYEAFGAMRDPNIEGYADHYGTIVRVITTVAEGDMIKMKEEYREKSGRALENDIFKAFVDHQDCLQLILMILNGLSDQGWFYRLVTETCNQEFGRDSIYRDLALRHLRPREYYVATVIKEFLSTKDLINATVEICSLDSSVLQQIKGIYPSIFGRELEDDIETFTLGDHRKLLLKHIGVPHGNAGVGKERLENTVRYLHQKVQETYKCPQLAIMDCIYELNEEDLRIAVERYSTEYRKPLIEDLTRARYGHFEHGLITKIRCAVNRPEFFAEKLYKAFGAMRSDPNIQGMIDADHHIDYETIVRVITTVAEGDMMIMKEEYRRKSKFELEDDISEAFADCQDCLHLILMILNSNARN